MNRISLSQAREVFFSSEAQYVSQEQSYIYYDNFSGEIALDIYMTYGCLVVKSGSDWHIHAISAESDLSSAIEEVSKFMASDTENLMVLTWNNIPEKLKDKRGAYKLAREYCPYSDQSVRQLTIDDYECVKECCSYETDDNQIGQNIAREFLEYYNDYINDTNTINLGLFIDNSLVGFVQSFKQKNQGISTINIYVARMHREKGYAKRLLSAICATNENMVYCYSCAKNNIASFNTAKSCGFQFKGAYLFI